MSEKDIRKAREAVELAEAPGSAWEKHVAIARAWVQIADADTNYKKAAAGR